MRYLALYVRFLALSMRFLALYMRFLATCVFSLGAPSLAKPV